MTDKPCFARQDAQIEEWIAVRRIGLALRAPALVPVAQLPAKVLLPGSSSGPMAQLAADANVLVLRNVSQQKAQVLELPSGKEIASVPLEGYAMPSVSPNGRMLANASGGSGKKLRIVETETGKPLWTTDKYDSVVAWGPGSGFVLVGMAGNGTPSTLDTDTGRIEPIPALEGKRLNWSLPAGPGRMLVGHSGSAWLLQHARGADGALQVQATQQWNLASYQNGPSPFLVNGGRRLAWRSNTDLAWLDMASGQQGKWQLSAIGATNYAPLSDQLVAFDVASRDGSGTATKVLDVDKGTVASAAEPAESGRYLLPLGPRFGFLRGGANALALVTVLEATEPQDAERLISDALTAREIAKLNDPYRSDFGGPNPGQTPEQRALFEQLARQARAGALPAGVAAPAAPLVGKTILNVPPDVKVAMLGVYQAAGSSRSTARTGTVNVVVGPGREPLVLVLSNYEKVNWQIQAGGRKIAAVLLSGYHESTVSGQGQAEVVRIGRQHAYKIDSGDFQILRREVARYVGPATPVFQGTYEGSLFQVQ
ncbi:hypothetical protein H8N03_04195 [Ramlibacter sp. USB13]|uniref:WD40 repeat domain-containing protein n=1 Tax=Ramlibacter cellulosilyticus TaxID=2764187 RepID=A0A923MNV3_9BURK|nr:hypothetical protein [Ramlibacter cellulosilyticus]MBC5782133.1 hypothetical protein [Ramlibacter cellulosilyticus]